jgi:hypothetical protein
MITWLIFEAVSGSCTVTDSSQLWFTVMLLLMPLSMKATPSPDSLSEAAALYTPAVTVKVAVPLSSVFASITVLLALLVSVIVTSSSVAYPSG